MNENPGETPNPLNPSTGANAGSSGVAMPTTENTVPVAESTTQVTENAPSVASETVATNTVVESLDPTGRTMEQAPIFVDKPKKKTGLIVGIIIGLIVLIGGGVAAAFLIMNLNKNDAVSAAMNKIMSGNAPKNVAIDGSINITMNDPSSLLTGVKIDLDSGMVTNSMVNTSTALVTLSMQGIDDISFEFDEVYADNGDLYFKVDGITDALEDSGLLSLMATPYALSAETNCIGTEEGESTNCVAATEVIDCDSEDDDCLVAAEEYSVTESQAYGLTQSLAGVLGVVETIDGEWLRISTDELNTLSGGMGTESNVSCITNMVSNMNTSSSSAAKLYAQYPFVKSSSEEVTVLSKKDPIYKLSIDSENFSNFVNSIQNSDMVSDIYSCLGWSNNVSADAADVKAMVANLPEIYAEVDKDDNFTRLYIETTVGEDVEADCLEEDYPCVENPDGTWDCDTYVNTCTTGYVAPSMTIDLSFDYPSSLDIVEPTEYVDFSSLIQEIFSSMYELSYEDM